MFFSPLFSTSSSVTLSDCRLTSKIFRTIDSPKMSVATYGRASPASALAPWLDKDALGCPFKFSTPASSSFVRAAKSGWLFSSETSAQPTLRKWTCRRNFFLTACKHSPARTPQSPKMEFRVTRIELPCHQTTKHRDDPCLSKTLRTWSCQYSGPRSGCRTVASPAHRGRLRPSPRRGSPPANSVDKQRRRQRLKRRKRYVNRGDINPPSATKFGRLTTVTLLIKSEMLSRKNVI